MSNNIIIPVTVFPIIYGLETTNFINKSSNMNTLKAVGMSSLIGYIIKDNKIWINTSCGGIVAYHIFKNNGDIKNSLLFGGLSYLLSNIFYNKLTPKKEESNPIKAITRKDNSKMDIRKIEREMKKNLSINNIYKQQRDIEHAINKHFRGGF